MMNSRRWVKPLVQFERWRGLLLTMLGAAASSSYGQQAAQPTAADFHEGDRWEWRQVDSHSKVESGQFSRTIVARDGELRVSDSACGELPLASAFTLDCDKVAAKPWRAWPLEVGRKWSTDVDWTRADGASGNTRQDAVVAALEEVTVPAGTYKAYRIELDGWYRNSRGGHGHQRDVFWYVPELHADVKHTRDDGYNQYTRELVTFRPATP